MTAGFKGLLVVAVAISYLQQCGCVHRCSLFDSGALDLKTVPERSGHYRDVHAHVEDHALRIAGFVLRSTSPAHVHVTVEDLDGMLLLNTRAEVKQILKSARRVRHARFEALILGSLPIGSTVRIRHHIGDCDESTPVDRGIKIRSSGS